MFESADEGHPEKQQELHFYYNREERLAKAPESVKKYYNGGMRPVTGIKIFFTPENRFILLALVVFVAFVWIYNGINRTRSAVKIGDVNFELQAFSFEEQVYVSLKMKAGKKYKPSVPEKVTADFFFIDNNSQVNWKESESVVFSGKDEILRVKSTDYDIIRVDAVINVNGEEKEVSSGITR